MKPCCTICLSPVQPDNGTFVIDTVGHGQDGVRVVDAREFAVLPFESIRISGPAVPVVMNAHNGAPVVDSIKNGAEGNRVINGYRVGARDDHAVQAK
jgi:hypothetical protein